MAGKWVCATAEWSKRGEAAASPQRRTRSGGEEEMWERREEEEVEEMFTLEVKGLMVFWAIIINVMFQVCP